ncbi:MAG: cysteine desulfurase NifS [Oscillospiraceae bacterium]|nr:cysteine desulfurase NifS [Oscillospiraceae bacterium]
MEKMHIYADNAATTCITKNVLDKMMPYLTEFYGNPSSIYKFGRDTQAAVENAREDIASCFGAVPKEIYFTAGGSESDNWAIKSTALRLGAKGKKHIITTNFEHHAVLHTCAALEKQGYEVTYLPVDEKGYVTADQVKNAIRPDTALVTVMYANNEIGTVQPIAEIGAVCREKGVLFHTDAVQAAGHVEINVKEQNIDMMSVSGHKIHAPKGVGFLYVRTGVALPPLIDGGAQERGKRAGTENVAGIIGLAEAVKAATKDIPEKTKALTEKRDRLIKGLTDIEGSRLNGGLENRLPGNINVSYLGVEGESLLLMLDMKGICASSGSACTSGSLDPSHVLLGLGLPHEVAHGSLRLSISEDITDEEVDYILKAVPEVVERIRSMSPLWEHIKKHEDSTDRLRKFVSEIK